MSRYCTDIQIINPLLPIGSIEAYLQRINQIPLLTAEEEHRFATEFHQHGDLKAAQKLVLAHIRYVARVARGYMGYGLPLGDLIQEGTIGLMKAVKRFDPTMGVRLVSFAVHWIKSEIHEFVLRNWRIVKIATTKAQRKLFFNLRSATKRLGWFTNEEVETLAQDLGVSAKEVRRMEQRLDARTKDTCFDLSHKEGEDDVHHTLCPAEYLEDQRANPEIQVETHNWNMHAEGQLKHALIQLDPRSRDILEKRWLTEDKKSTLQELAETYNVSPERIRQLEKTAMLKIKENIKMIEAA